MLAQEISRLIGQILGEYAAVLKKLAQAKPFAAAYADMQSQLDTLEEPDASEDPLTVDVGPSPGEIAEQVIRLLSASTTLGPSVTQS